MPKQQVIGKNLVLMMKILHPTFSSLSLAYKMPWQVYKRGFQLYAIYALYDQAIANIQGFHTLRHGTNLLNYFGIQWHGADPTQGGVKSAFNQEQYASECEGKFYVFLDVVDTKTMLKGNLLLKKDKAFNINMPIGIYVDYFKGPLGCLRFGFLKRVQPRTGYAWQSGGAIAKRFEPGTFFWFFASFAGPFSALLLTPTVKFRFDSEDMSQFSSAYLQPGFAVFTKDPIGWKHMGISGSLIQGWKWRHNWAKRIREKPYDPVLGIIQLFLAIGLTGKLLGVHNRLKCYNFLYKENFFLKNGIRLFHFTTC